MSDSPSNREGPQAREPFKCLNRQSYRERLAQKTCLSATRGSKKNSDRAITSATEAVRVPVHLVLPGSPQAKQQHHLHAQLSLGQSCHRQKKKVMCLCAQGHLGPVRFCDPVDCGLPGFSVRKEVFQARILECIGQYWLPFSSRALYFLLP